MFEEQTEGSLWVDLKREGKDCSEDHRDGQEVKFDPKWICLPCVLLRPICSICS